MEGPAHAEAGAQEGAFAGGHFGHGAEAHKELLHRGVGVGHEAQGIVPVIPVPGPQADAQVQVGEVAPVPHCEFGDGHRELRGGGAGLADDGDQGGLGCQGQGGQEQEGAETAHGEATHS